MSATPAYSLKPVSTLPILANAINTRKQRHTAFRYRQWLTGICLLAITGLGACTNRTELDNSVQNLTFSTLNGNKIALNQVTGPVLVNFWSTSCVVCIHEMPEMAELYRQYQPLGFELIAVAMPYDAPNLVVELAEDKQLPFPVALDLKGEAVDAFGSVVGTPTSFLLATDGTLVKRFVGAIKFDQLRSELNKLMDIS